MTQEDEDKVRQLIQEQLSQLFASDRYIFHKNIQIMDGRNIQLGLTTGTKIGTSTLQKIGFFNATPVSQYTSNNAPGIYWNGSSDAVKVDSTFGGISFGTDQFTIGEIVTALKKLGFLRKDNV